MGDVVCIYHVASFLDASPPSDVTAVQDGPTSIRVSWTPSSDATGYRIQYEGSGGDRDSVIVDGGSSNNHLLTGLERETTYTVYIVTTSQRLPSEPIRVEVTLGGYENCVAVCV